MNLNTDYQELFEKRHIAPNEIATAEMLKALDVNTLDELIGQMVPAKIRLKQPLQLPAAKSEFDYLANLKQTASKNRERIRKTFRRVTVVRSHNNK